MSLTPYTDEVQAEAARRDRLYRHERALGNLTNVRRSAEHLEKKVPPYREQLALYDKLDKLVVLIDGGIQGPGSFLVREQVIRQLSAARADQQRRLDKIQTQLAQLTGELPRLEAAVQEFT